MENQKIDKTSNFWFGFIIGIAFTSTVLFLFGSKKGREFLKNILELSENFEENLELIIEKSREKLEEKGEEIDHLLKNPSIKKNQPNLHLLLNKIKNRLTF